MNPRRIVLVRHGESEGNLQKLGGSELANIKPNHKFSLTKKGREQAARTGEYVRERFGKFDAYFASEYLRTQETFAEIFPDIIPIIDSRLNELWRGLWHVLPKEEIKEKHSDEYAGEKRDGWYFHRPQHAKNCPDIENQIHSFLNFLQLNYSGKDVFLSAHGDWALLLWKILENKTPDDVVYRHKNKKLGNASITIYENIDGRLRLTEEDIRP